MEPAKFGQFLSSADARLGAEAAERAAADDRARQRERFERELAKIDAALARAEARQAARQERETEELYRWMKTHGPQRRERRGSQAGSGQERRGGGLDLNGLIELRAKAERDGSQHLAQLLTRAIQRKQGKDVQPPLERKTFSAKWSVR
jgi:hypothetical protein